MSQYEDIDPDDLDVLDREVAGRLVGRALGLAESLPVGSPSSTVEAQQSSAGGDDDRA